MTEIINMKTIDSIEGIPRPKILRAYFVISENELNNVINLYKWCEETFIELTNQGCEVHRMRLETSGNRGNRKEKIPKSMMFPEELNRQCRIFELWQKEKIKHLSS
jgi:hypothetical protein